MIDRHFAQNKQLYSLRPYYRTSKIFTLVYMYIVSMVLTATWQLNGLIRTVVVVEEQQLPKQVNSLDQSPSTTDKQQQGRTVELPKLD